MPILSGLRALARNLLGKRDETRLDLELGGYIDLLTDEKIAAGMRPEDARRAARMELGGVEQVKEAVREERAGAIVETTLRDLRYGWRMLARNPGFTAAAVIALALGIGASSAIFSVVNAILLRPLPYGDPAGLTVLLHRGENPVSPANFLDWKREMEPGTFERMGAAEMWTPNAAGAGPAESLRALRVTPDILPLLHVQPLLGREFLPEEGEPGREKEVVLGYGIWQRRFGGDRSVLGRKMLLNGESYTVVGVMPKSFAFPPFWATGADLWAPLALAPRAASREGNSLRVFARRKEGVSLETARAHMAAIAGRLERQYPGTNREVTVRTLHDTVVGNVRPALLVLLGAVGFVLLIACANVAHMLLARAASRHREMAVRTALGSSRSRTFRQLLTESIVLASAGGAAGLLLAAAGIRALIALGPASLPRLASVGLDGRVVAFTLAVSLLTGIGFGLAPAIQVGRREVIETLREGERGSTEGLSRNRLRSLLVGSEFALALVLLICAGLMIRSFRALQAIDPGFDSRNVLTMIVSVAGTPEGEPSRRAGFYREVLARVRAVPGVLSASAINHLPLAGDIWGFPYRAEGRPAPKPGEAATATYRVVFPGYFQTMRLPILRGRDVAEADRLGAPGVVVVNQWLAEHTWPGADAIGKRITVDDSSWLTVVGVVKNAARGDWAAAPSAEFYLPFLQSRSHLESPGSQVSYATLVLRTSGDPAHLTPSVRAAIASIDPGVPISDVQTMEQVVSHSTSEPRFYLLLLATFAAVALILAAIGIYGVMSYSVSRRIHEIGIRMALGAGRGDLVRLVVGQGMLVAAIGAAVGLLGAFALTRLMSSLLYGVRPTDPVTYAGVSLLLGVIAFTACWIPARRATRIDPLTALRHD